LTTEPASSRVGRTAKTLGATAKLKKHAAPSHNPSNKVLPDAMKFIVKAS
jgi:hypothetical protein